MASRVATVVRRGPRSIVFNGLRRDLPVGRRILQSGTKDVPVGRKTFQSGAKDLPVGRKIFQSGTKDVLVGRKTFQWVENRDRLVALGPDARRAGAHTPI